MYVNVREFNLPLDTLVEIRVTVLFVCFNHGVSFFPKWKLNSFDLTFCFFILNGPAVLLVLEKPV